MKRLTGLDATFLHLENSTQFGRVSGLAIFARPDVPGYDPYAAWRGQLEQRLHLLEPLRRRLVEVPLGIDHPCWINDPDFDLDFHVRHTAVPPPGGDDQLANTVARIVSRPLDRCRPLWLSYVIEGLSDDRSYTLLDQGAARVAGLLAEKGSGRATASASCFPTSRTSRSRSSGCCGSAPSWCR
jgi:diacylglycerol O-acyltransferase